jgi:hypothetical protein
VDQDRTRRALSDGLFIFLLRTYHHRENSKILQKNGTKTYFFKKNLGRFAQEADQEWTKIELDELYPMDYLFFSQEPSIIAKNLKYCQKTNRTQKNLGRFSQEVD